MVEKIIINNSLYAIIVNRSFSIEGISFFTPDNFPQQLAYMKHSKGKVIRAHIHNKIMREVIDTSEVLFIKKGRLRVDFYDANQKYLECRILSEGDVILLLEGGHGFVALDDLEMFEVKQGPYVGGADKIRFNGDQTKI